jgi:Predicted AAA-ATPase/PD-(D/E)XK nuclease superfamily
MIKIPYGKSDYRSMVEGKYFYQDRTNYIQTLESIGPTYLLYLRPRRFGKTLLLSMLRYYYGLQYKQDFDALFSHTFIGKNPTPNANKYMVLHFDFSSIDTTTETGVFEGFLKNVFIGIDKFSENYPNYLSNEQKKELFSQKQPNDIIKTLFSYLYKYSAETKVYLLIDEYDHFANELISFNFNHFIDIVTRNGYVRKFYEAIKIATSDGLVERMLMTGVSPITMDSLTSGFNIAKNITLSPLFHQMVGFEEKEVEEILKGVEMPSEQIPSAMNDMRLWYNGYSFNPDINQKVYNPNMVLYFADEYAAQQSYPLTMLDANIASDYSKIKKLFSIQDSQEKYEYVLRALLENGETNATLTSQFSFERGFNEDDLISLLFYMGFLTIKSRRMGMTYNFSFPNYVIKKLYADYFLHSILESNHLPINNRPVNDAMLTMAETGNPIAFFEQVSLVIKYFSTRDAAHFNENTLKAIIISLLHQQSFYYIHSEYETNWTYMDIFLEAIHGQKPTYEVAMELKYVKKGGKKAIDTLLQAAITQLQGYLDTPKFNYRMNIKSFVVVVAGDKLHWRELK